MENDNNEQETFEMQFEEFALKTNVLAFASRSKAKARPRRRTSGCSSTITVPIGERKWTDIEPEDYSLIAYPVSKTTEYSSSSWSSTSRRWWSDWVLEITGVSSERSCAFSTLVWCKVEEYCTDPSGPEILYLRALQGHSGRNLIDPSLQDNLLIPNDFFEYVYHIGCAINLNSIMNSGLIPGGQNLSKKQTEIFTSVDPMNKEHKDPNNIWPGSTTSCMVQTEDVEETSKHGVLGRHQTCSQERILSSIKQDRTQSSFTTRSQLIVSRRLSWWELE